MQINLIPFAKTEELFINASITIDNNILLIEYKMTGEINNITLRPFKDISKRRWELWEESCFELFIKHPDKKEYIEFNFSSANEWNCFYIGSYRDNQGEYQPISNVVIETKQVSQAEFSLTAKIDLNNLPLFNKADFLNNKMVYGITTITQFQDNKKEYWALKHNKQEPDFHDNSTFISLINM